MRHRLSILIALAAAFAVGCRSSAPAGHGASISAPFPSVPLVAFDGSAIDLRAVLHGRVAVVSLWATWCDSCVGELDALDRLQRQAGAREDAVVVGVAIGESREAVAQFARKRGLVYAQFVDEDFRLADALGEQRVPATLVVDRAGRIVFRGRTLDAAGLAAFRAALERGP